MCFTHLQGSTMIEECEAKVVADKEAQEAKEAAAAGGGAEAAK